MAWYSIMLWCSIIIDTIPSVRYSIYGIIIMQWYGIDSVHKGEDRDRILSTTEEPETNVADSFDGSGVRSSCSCC